MAEYFTMFSGTWLRNAAAMALLAAASPAAARPAVLELFTSQGCSSCPPADKVLAEAAKIPGVVAISRPVTYWDRLGWKDTLARPENTERQRGYRKLSGRSGVYTPQLVIDGDWEGNGAKRNSVLSEVGKTLKEPTGVKVSFGRTSGGRFTVDLAGGKGTGEVTMIAIEASPSVAIERGENRGREITYTNVVKREYKLGRWEGGRRSWGFDPASIEALPGDRIAVVVQEPDLGRVLGAGIFER